MRYSIRFFTTALVLVSSAMLLTACGNLSKNIAPDGSGAGKLVWPKPDATNGLYSGGTSPTLASLRNIHPGMSKQAIADLIGYPQYGEGIAFTVREWDYLFNLKSGNGWVKCQYKVLFDKNKKAQSFYWKSKSCGDLVSGKSPVEKFTLSGDALFAFDKSTITPKGSRQLDDLARKINEHQGDITSIGILGYTDVIGSRSYNMQLSRQRAQSVKRYLAGRGVPASLMTAQGMGPDDPVKTDCPTGVSRDQWIACLAPNRRVEISVAVKQQQKNRGVGGM